MKRQLTIRIFALFCALMVSCATFFPYDGSTVAAQGSATPAAGQSYVVQKGDTLLGIAIRFGVNYSELVSINKIANPNLIHVGQSLLLPGSSSTVQPTPDTTASPGEGQWYLVRRGDTLGGIAVRFGVSSSVLIRTNSISNPNLLYVGQRLWIPGSSSATPAPTAVSGQPSATPTPEGTSSGGQWYSVRSGDTLYGIALRFGVGYNALISANSISNPNLIRVGQKLWIPSGGSSAPGVAPTSTPQSTAPTPSGDLYSFGYGFQIDPYDDNKLLTAVAAVQSAGFGWVKIQVPWYNIEPNQKGIYNWSQLDRLMDQFSAAGLKVMLSVVKAPDWARSASSDLTVEGPPEDPQDLADTMAAIAARYKGRLHALEVWNEQNLAYEWGNEPLDASRYVKMLCAVYKSVKAVDSSIAIISGGLTPTGVTAAGISVDDLDYLRQMYAAGCKACMDGLGAHPSGYNNPPDVGVDYTNAQEPTFKAHRSFYFQETMLSYRTVMANYNDAGKRIWPTEFGWASSASPSAGYEYAANVTEAEQAQYLVKAYQMMKAWGWVGPAFCWNLNYNDTSPGTEMAQFGIWNRPAYSSLRDMVK
ncbi:MAG: LysM peptidoglycan-binding domain-containing protein [Chloroflexi bacterium]|nr:LysM peptidoglycan-binding domain-containing protein [Chloroflexota bacterium]